MSNGENQPKRHLSIDNFYRSSPYSSHKRGNSTPVPIRQDFRSHGTALKEQVTRIQNEYARLSQSWEGREDILARGIVIEIEGAPEMELSVTRFEEAGLELLNERDERNAEGKMVARQTWFVPDGKLDVIGEYLNDYLTKTRKTNGVIQPLYRSFVDAIEKISQAAAKQLWTEREIPFPENTTQWLEVWLRAGSSNREREDILNQFRILGAEAGIRIGIGRINLPEHTVVSAYGRGEFFTSNFALLNCLAELRIGREYADFFDNLTVSDQSHFAYALRRRVQPAQSHLPYIGILDTGANRGHPLLEILMKENDNLTIQEAWGSADDDDHGTPMSGLCLFGDLSLILDGDENINVPVNIESIKIVPPPEQRGDDEKLAGYYTAQGIALAEATNPDRRRVWCLATSMKGPNDPRPTSWSSGLDLLASGQDNGGVVRRLICLSSGNVDQEKWKDYPESNFDHQVENPSQSWNALCVGAFTDFSLIRPPHHEIYRPLVNRGCMSPCNGTSRTWDHSWPNKPDVVFEGGNAGHSSANNSTLQLPELMPLSTSGNFREGAFVALCGTSPATAFASRMAGQIMSEYPELWPETVRGLIVHSASWTDAMVAAMPKRITDKERARLLLRSVGYGVPNLKNALECAKSRATMIAQCELTPFKIEKNEIVFNEMHLHGLPWPSEILAANPFANVRLKVTLSYFIEPNPGSRGYTTTFRYPGCQLRFRVSSPGQSDTDLEAQVSKAVANEMKKNQSHAFVKGSPDGWILGEHAHRGSIRSDTWEGTAADLLSMKYIAIFPLTGWWRTRPKREKANARIKYGLTITLEEIGQELDLYSEIASLIPLPLSIQTS